jgi:hypothetical protein
MKFDLQLDFHMKIILSGQIDHLNFENGETIRSNGPNSDHIYF